MNERSYLSTHKMTRAAASRKALLIAGGIIVGLFALMFPIAFTTNPELKQNLVFYGVCMLPGLFLIWRGIKLGKQMDMARRFDSVFSCDRDGFVTAAELVHQSGMGEQETMQQLELLFRKGYFERCTLHRHSRVGVELDDAEIGDSAGGFVNAVCAHCGGTTRLRAGTIGKCDFCGGSVRAETE